ncbi:Hypp9361 [Branchiostoma lanceolatum]|uniref:Hypp9361 protein n=1 Tax=Branchiostoma lanceolatum TaxID=7740 RepID=A0A8S4MLF6_BRALA|nr:Hypp9361 [Branchiostoma lanceolatum]
MNDKSEKSVAVVRTEELSDNAFNPNGDTETAVTTNTDVNENDYGTGKHNFDICNVKKEASGYPSPCSNMHQAEDDIVEEPACKRHCASLRTDHDAEEMSTSRVTNGGLPALARDLLPPYFAPCGVIWGPNKLKLK